MPATVLSPEESYNLFNTSLECCVQVLKKEIDERNAAWAKSATQFHSGSNYGQLASGAVIYYEAYPRLAPRGVVGAAGNAGVPGPPGARGLTERTRRYAEEIRAGVQARQTVLEEAEFNQNGAFLRAALQARQNRQQ